VQNLCFPSPGHHTCKGQPFTNSRFGSKSRRNGFKSHDCCNNMHPICWPCTVIQANSAIATEQKAACMPHALPCHGWPPAWPWWWPGAPHHHRWCLWWRPRWWRWWRPSAPLVVVASSSQESRFFQYTLEYRLMNWKHPLPAWMKQCGPLPLGPLPRGKYVIAAQATSTLHRVWQASREVSLVGVPFSMHCEWRSSL